ncbi:conserved hypothetical protein [uncultured Alphaproteobacteria bacterium]|jgi:hypothetical protein|uniref:Uncharacterized protein n=1 Tax=uncultured Alphaproteobacteria bacterium TaxID=91750 RepID=A0A212JGT6_9PROT|nr:conserved hypothetical protein [uncultured Alphaproteobacteria bacterium]
MADCPCLPKCPFFLDRMADMPSMANKLKDKYCRDDFAHCARYMVFKALGPGRSPDSLFPAQVDQARRIIAAAHP